MSIDARLSQLGIQLPPPKAPAYAYVPVACHGDLAWVSGQLPWRTDGSLPQGKLGAGVTVEEGREAARLCVLNALSLLKAQLGSLDHIVRVVKVTGFVASAPGFIDQPSVMDGASSLLLEIFGEAGRHARSAVGMAELPRAVPVEVEFVFAFKP
jgi:enamine deaminase RidA (YjgF/YER057c/UK114 family)